MREPTSDPTRSATDVLDRAAETIAVPRHDEGDSFVLHAPLEVLARSALLTLVAPHDQAGIRSRIDTVAATYRQWGEPFEPAPRTQAPLEDDAPAVLLDALESGDLDAADHAICSLTNDLDTADLVRTLAEPVLPSLAAAAHGSILLYLLPRVAARSGPAAAMARTTVHELARHPDWKLTWLDRLATGTGRTDTAISAERELTERLVAPVLDDQPGVNFIFPTMHAVESAGLADELLGDLVPLLSLRGATRSLLRLAAHSMLQDDAAHAPYGWSHCLTMPQAALGVAAATGSDSIPAIAVAATYVLGFRSTLSGGPIAIDWAPARVEPDPAQLLEAEPAIAAAHAWHAGPDAHRTIWRTLAAHAGSHEDAHLAKYTLACIDATRADPDQASLYRAAAAFLNAWWIHESA